jgi:hypothetical protein
MNMLDVQDKLKGLSEQQLVQEMQMPSGSAPQFLVLSEITRRKRMRDGMQQQPDNTTVAQEAVAAAGVPQGGIADMAMALAPKTDMTQNTGASTVQGMYGGGYVQKMQPGGFVDSKSLVPYSQQNFPSALASDPAVIAMAQRLGIPVEEYIASLSPDTRAKNLQRVVDGRITQAPRSDVFDPTVPALSQVDGTQEFRPYTSDAIRGSLIPTQEDLDASYRASLTEEPRFRQAPYEQFPEAGGLASPPQSLYPPVPVGNPIPGEEPSFYTPPERLQPMSPMERLRAGTDYMRSGEGLPAYNEFRGVFDARENPMLTAAEESAKEAAALRDSAGITQSLRDPKEVAAAAAAAKQVAAADAEAEDSMTQVPSPLELPEPPGLSDLLAGDTTTGGTRTSGGVGSASGATSYEQELINAMQRAERRAQQDKWLALAQVGLGLMSSTQPTLGGALGEAGIAGLQSYQGARDEYEAERLGFSKELAGIEAARASQRAASAKASSGPTLKEINDNLEMLTTEVTGYDADGNEVTRRVPIDDDPRTQGLIKQYQEQKLALLSGRIAPQM